MSRRTSIDWKWTIGAAVALGCLIWWMASEFARLKEEDDLIRSLTCEQRIGYLSPDARSAQVAKARDALRRDPQSLARHCAEVQQARRDALQERQRLIAGDPMIPRGRTASEIEWLESLEACRNAAHKAIDDLSQALSDDMRHDGAVYDARVRVAAGCTPPR